MKRVRVVATGGTIASKRDPRTGGAVPTLTGKDMIEALPGIEGFAEVDTEQFSNVPSQALTLQQVLELGKRCKELFQRGEADGAVITMGTNTMAEFAYLLDLTVDAPNPMVITGAMRNTSMIAPEGPRNLFDAIVTAASEEARGKGVLVCMNGDLLFPRDVVKAHSVAVNTFQDWEFGPLGAVRNNRVIFYRLPTLREKLPVERITARVDLITAVGGDDGKLLDASISSGADGIVLASMGPGHVTPMMTWAIKKAIDKGIPVVLVSHSYGGNLLENGYGFEGGDIHLRQLGCIFGGSLQGLKARIKLILALSQTRDIGKIRSMFQNV